MTPFHYRSTGLRLAAMAALFFLSACAGSVAPPDVIQSIQKTTNFEQYSKLTVVAEAAPGVPIVEEAKSRIIGLVRQEVSKKYPKYFSADTGNSSTLKLNMLFKSYDEGNAFARAMLAGLGQIHIDADVTLTDDVTNQTIGKFKVSKQFAFGGIVGAATDIKDVEAGFATSVAEVFGKTVE